ncbi:MAG TPA: glycosyltransferase 87 family protein [Microlunatus sp.]
MINNDSLAAPSPTTSQHRSRAAAAAVLIIAVATIVVVDVAVLLLQRERLGRWALLIAVLLFGLIAVLLRHRIGPLRVRTIMIITGICQLPGLLFRPTLTDDAYRFVWDGRVQLAGIDPYRYPPLAAALRFLRDPLLFPPGSQRPLINRPSVHTIYPPIAELWFTLFAAVTPWQLGTLGVQLGAAVVAVITTGLLARELSSAGPSGVGRGTLALLYGACPAVTIEAANGAHPDVLAALLILLMGLALIRRRHRLAGLFLGLAAGVKLVPLLLLPVFVVRGRRRTLAIAPAVLLASYLPHLITVGSLVIGYLPGYLQEEGFDGSSRFALLIFLPEPARLPVALMLSVSLAVLAVLRSRREPAVITCCWLYGAAFLVATPAYPWYLLPVMVLAILARRLEWLALWPAAYIAFLYGYPLALQTAGYAAALLVVLIAAARRSLRPADDSRPDEVLD